MRVYCKNVLIILVLLFSVHLNAQSIKVGTSVFDQFVLGETAALFSNNLGTSLDLDFGFSNHFGERVELNYAKMFSPNEDIEFAWLASALIGIWFQFSLYNETFFFQPGLAGGMVYQNATLSDEYDSLEKTAYIDFIGQVSAAFLYRPHILNDAFYLNFTPTYTFIPSADAFISCLGLKIGLMYNFMEKRK